MFVSVRQDLSNNHVYIYIYMCVCVCVCVCVYFAVELIFISL